MLGVPPEVDGGERERAEHDERKRAPVALPARRKGGMGDVGESEQHREVLRKKCEPEKHAGKRLPAGRAPGEAQPESERRGKAEENERRVGGDEDAPDVRGQEQKSARGEHRLRFVRAASAKGSRVTGRRSTHSACDSLRSR